MRLFSPHRSNIILIGLSYLLLFSLCVFGQTNNLTEKKKQYYKYKGKIGTTTSITMDFTISGNYLSGYFYYDKYGIPVPLHGSFTDTNTYELKAGVDSGSVDRFLGKNILSDALKGIWSNSSSKKSLPFKLLKETDGFVPILFEVYSASHGSSNISIEVPKIATSNDSINNLINCDISKSLIGIVNNWTGKSFTTIASYIGDKDLFDPEEEALQITYQCDVETNENNILALVFFYDSFAKGWPHPNYDYYLINYDISTGKRIVLPDLFISKYKVRLNTIGRNIYEKTYHEQSNHNFKLTDNFGITHSGLRFLWHNYEMGYGCPDIFMPYNKIESIIIKNCILHQFILLTKPNDSIISGKQLAR
jgi:hypothetical protein